MKESITRAGRRPSRGRSVGLVAFMFGLTRRERLPAAVLLRLLGDLGLTADAGRALLSRMRRQGQLVSHRHLRTVEYALAGEFARSFERVRVQAMARPGEWTGHFHAVLYAVPESHRAFRDALRRTAVLSGYGILQQGTLISFVDRRAQLAGVLAGRPYEAHVWMSTLAMSTEDAAAAASLAWDLPELARRFQEHTGRLGHEARQAARAACLVQGAAPDDGRRAVRDYVTLLLPALVDTLRDPGVPSPLLPPNWPGPALRRSITELEQAYAPRLDRYLEWLFEQHPAVERSQS